MEDKELNIIDHLDELRKRLMIIIAAFIILFIVGFVYVEEVYHWLVKDLNVKLMVLGPSDIIWVYFMIASVIAIAGTIPILALQIWLFVKPALTTVEKRVTLSYIPALFILFIVGLCFGYFIIFPSVMNFLLDLGGEMMATNFTADKYFRFIFNMTIPFGVLFELPVIMMFLTSLGIINPYILNKMRKYAYFVLIIVAIVISPPDFMSDFLVAIPLIFLYEISVNLSKIVYKKKEKKRNLEMVESIQE
jgi:sec-independent protein translocase protein TatC